MRQRVMIAMAMLLEPQIMIMDEPTTALDVVVQREILARSCGCATSCGFAVVFITHDLPLLLEISDRIAVMLDGEIVELAAADRTSTATPGTRTRASSSASFPSLTGERAARSSAPASTRPRTSATPPTEERHDHVHVTDLVKDYAIRRGCAAPGCAPSTTSASTSSPAAPSPSSASPGRASPRSPRSSPGWSGPPRARSTIRPTTAPRSAARCTGGRCRWSSRTRSRRSTRSTRSSTTSPARCGSTAAPARGRDPPTGAARCSNESI